MPGLPQEADLVRAGWFNPAVRLSLTQQGDCEKWQITSDHAAFVGVAQGNLEVHLNVDPTSVTYKMGENGMFEGDVEVLLFLQEKRVSHRGTVKHLRGLFYTNA